MSETTVGDTRDERVAALADDFLRRHRAGTCPDVAEYAAEHPDLADHIRELFPAMLAMEQPGLGAAVDVTPAAERVGAVVGRYKLLERIGEGGFGVVYMAEQQHPVRRKVALKVIKPGVDTRQVVARFEAERQALALMEHENIARVLDGGATDSGRPYFVMELVYGVPITEYSDRAELSTRERLELFVQVCRAVQHAHSKGVIHRDLKPTNVLVTLHEGVAVPKVIDFGVAKATGQQLTDKTLFTNFQQMLGTPLYMSPEQAELTGVDVDTRSDVYSLGVLLYELLTGTTPLDSDRLKKAAFDEVRRIIREEDPPRPSTRLSTMGELARTVSSRRKSDPRQLGRLVRGELDWIVMKALEKERARRYDTAIGLARDVERYLVDEPVQACSPSATYRLRKFVRRNKAKVAAAGVVLAALVAGIAGTTWGMIRASERAEGERRAREETQKRLTQVENATEILASVFQDLDPVGAEREGVTLLDLLSRRLSQAARQVEGEAVGDPLVVARIQHALGASLFELSRPEQAEDLLVDANATRQRILGPNHLETAATMYRLAVLYRQQDRLREAEQLLKDVVAVRTAQLGAEHSDTLDSRQELAAVYQSQCRYRVAEALFKELIAVRTARFGAHDPDTLATQHRLANLYTAQGNFALSETLHKELLAVRTARFGADNLGTVATKVGLGSLYRAQGKFELAEALFSEALAVRTSKRGPRHHDTLQVRDHLATLYLWRGNFDRAEAMYKDVLEARVATRGANHPETLVTKYNLATLHRWRGKLEAAESLYKEVLSAYADTIGADHPSALAIRHDLATICLQRGDDVRAELLFKEVVAGWTAQLGPDHPSTLTTLYSLAELYHWQRREHARAEPMYKQVLAGRSARLGPDHVDTVATRKSLAELYRNLGQFDLAEPLLKEVLASRNSQFGPDHPDTLYAQHELVILYRWMKAFDQAIPLAEDMVQRCKASDPVAIRRMRAELGSIYYGAGRFGDAIPYLEGAHREASNDASLNWVGNALLKAYAGVGNTDATVALALEQARSARERFPADSPELAAAVQAPGEALMQVQAFTDAEPLLLMGFKGMRQAQAIDPDKVDPRLQDAITRLVLLYDSWGKSDEAAKWRQVPESP